MISKSSYDHWVRLQGGMVQQCLVYQKLSPFYFRVPSEGRLWLAIENVEKLFRGE